jgi:hypothetical protein
MNEKFDLSKFLGSFIQPLGWVKSLSLGLKIFIIVFVAFTIYKAYFVKTQSQHNQITVGQGGIVNVQQNTEKKRSWWMPTPFVDVYTFVETDDRKGVGMRGGARWEF